MIRQYCINTRRMPKPESQYSYSAHNYRSSPWLQIYDARHMKVDTTQYQNNRTYYSKLYKSMKTAGIQHQDILSIWGNPYIGTVTKWNELSYQRKQSLKLQYPEMEKLAENIEEQRRDFYDKVWWNISEPAKRFLDEYAFAISAIASTNPYGRAAVGLVRTGQAVVAIAPKMVKLITTLGSVELARQFQILYKKNSDGNSTRPRVQATRGDADKYLSGLKNQGVLGKKGVTKDGHEFYQFVKKCEYKGIKFKKDEYISRDTQHHEWEYFRSKDYHKGAIDPLTGKLNVKKRSPGRTLKLP